MKKLAKLISYGFLIWLIPFGVSILIFPLHESERSLFESIMPVVISACAVFFSVRYLTDVTSEFLREGLIIGTAWTAISILMDLPLFLEGPFKMPLLEYIKDIGLTYLIIPLITIGFGCLLKRKWQSSQNQKAD
jgi:hypothetical protein